MVVGETVGILRAMGHEEAFKTLGKDIKILLLDQANRLEKLIDDDLKASDTDSLSAKEQFLLHY